jgi:hypothetical protein
MNPDLTALYKKQYETLSDRLAKMDLARDATTPEAMKRVSVGNRVELENPMTRIEAGMNIGNTNSKAQIQSMQLQMEALNNLRDSLMQEREMTLKEKPEVDTLSTKDILDLKIKAGEKGYEVYQKEDGTFDVRASSVKTAEQQKAADAKSETLGLIDEILGSDLGPVTGLMQLRSIIPGTKAKTTAAKIDQLKSQLSLDKRSLLKGSGQISDFESKMLEKSVGALDRNMSETDFKAELQKIKSILSGTTVTGLDPDDEDLINKYKSK